MIIVTNFGGKSGAQNQESTRGERQPGLRHRSRPPGKPWGFKGFLGQTRGLILHAWNSEKLIAFFENPLLLFRLKEKSSNAPSLVSQPWVGASSRLISLLAL
jgi:hypothetical protein